MDPKLQALLTAAHDAVIVIRELADDCPDTQSRDWAMHRHAPLVEAMAAVIGDIAAQRGLSPEQVMEEIKSASTIRDTPDFPEDPEESPFAEPSRWLSGGPPSRQRAWWINLGDGEGFDLYEHESERDAAANTILSEARDEAREFDEWPDGDVDSIHSWTMGTLMVTHVVKPTGGVIDGTDVADYAWTREAEGQPESSDGDTERRRRWAREYLCWDSEAEEPLCQEIITEDDLIKAMEAEASWRGGR